MNYINNNFIKFYKNNKIYYYNQKNKKVTPKKPNETYIPNEKSNWMIIFNESTKRFFYYNKMNQIKNWFPFFKDNIYSTINSYTYNNFIKNSNYQIYLSNGKMYKNTISQKIFNRLQNENTLIIGNSIAGKLNFIKYLSILWNDTYPFDPLNIIWKEMNSMECYNNINLVDLAITYEPKIENVLYENDKIDNLEHLFLSQFELISSENDEYNLKGIKDNSPLNLITYLIKSVLLQDMNDNQNKEESKFIKVFIKNTSNSTISIKETFLFFKAINNILDNGFDDYNTEKLFNIHFNLGRLSKEEKIKVIYNEWMNHVIETEDLNLLEVLDKIKTNKTFKKCYHINDRFLIFKSNLEHNIITNTNYYDIYDYLQNYAQIWSGSNKLSKNSTQYRFLDWLIKNKVDIINYWFPINNKVSKKLTKLNYSTLYYSNNNYNIVKILNSYNNTLNSNKSKKIYGNFKAFL